MLPARDRITALYVYSSKANALANTGGTEYTEGIVDSTPRLERVFFTALPAFGECNAAMFECELNINVNLKGKWIRVATQAYASDAATTRTTYWLFCGLVDSCKYDARQATRKLVAYDEMYTLKNTDISAWWKSYWASQSGAVASNTVLAAMMSQFGVQGTAATQYGNAFTILAESQKDAFSGCSFAQMLSYFGLVKPSSFYIDVTGKLALCDYSAVNKTNTAIALDGNVDTVFSEFGDAACEEFGSVVINVGSETSYRDGSGEPTLTIQDNPLLYGKSASDYVSVAQNLLTVAKKMSAIHGAEIEMVVSTNDVLEHTAAVSYDGVTYMPSGITLYGAQMLSERIDCEVELNDTPSYRQSIKTENIADGAVRAEKIDVDDLNALNATIAGWNIGTNKISKAVNGKVAEISSETPKVLMSSENHYAEVNGNAEITTYYGGGQWADVSQGETVMKGQEISQDYDVWEVHATYADWVRKSESSLTDATLTLKGREIDPDTQYLEDNFHTAVLDERDLTFDGHSLKRLTPHLAQMWSTQIPANADLNTATYLKVGQYFCYVSPSSFLNCPTTEQFVMCVEAFIYSTYDDESVSGDRYRVRKITTYQGNQYIQWCGKPTNGSWTYGEWKRVFTSSQNDAIYYDQLGTRNIADNGKIVQGSISGTGADTTADTRIRTDFITVSSNTNYYFATNSTLQIYEIHEYTSSAWIKYTTVNATTKLLKTSATTKRVKVLMRFSDNRALSADEGAKLQVNQSTVAVGYSPFEPKQEAVVPWMKYGDLGVSSTDSAFFQAWLRRIGRNYESLVSKFIKAVVTPNGTGIACGHLYGGTTSDSTPKYSGFLYIGVGTAKYFGTINGSFYIRDLLDSNVTTGTATKNTTYIGTGTVKWTKSGRTVHLQGSFYAKSAMYSAGGRNLFTGVPAAYSTCECLAVPVGDSSYYNSNIIPLVIDSSGNVIANFSGTRLFDEEVPFIIDTTYIS